MHTIGKSIAIFVTATLVLNAMAPALAHAAKHLQGEQVNANALVRDAYIAVTYRDGNDRERTAKGWIDAIGETAFTIRSGGLKSKTTIAYAKVLSVIMSEESSVPAKQMNEVNRVIRNKAQAIQRFNQQFPTVMTREQIDLKKIRKGWYAHVVYTPKRTKETVTGWIVGKGANRIAIKKQNWERWIAYSDIDTLIVAKHKRDIDRWKNARQTLFNAKVRFKAPSISQRQIIGEVIKMNRDTVVIQGGHTFYQVPMSSISNFEVSIGQRRNAGKGFMIGLGLGLIILVPIALVDLNDEDNDWRGLATFVTAVYIFPSIVVLSTLMGATIKSEKWVEVPPQRLNLSIAPTPDKGLRAALTFNF